MKRFFGNSLWLIFAIPFYVVMLLCCAYSLMPLGAIGRVFARIEPYKFLDKIDKWVYNTVKTFVIMKELI